MCAVWPVLCAGIARRCDFCDKTLSLCQNRQGNVFSRLLEFVLGLIIMYWDYIIQKWSPSRASCHLFLVSLVPEQLPSWCGAVPCVDQAAGLWRNRYLSSWLSLLLGSLLNCPCPGEEDGRGSAYWCPTPCFSKLFLYRVQRTWSCCWGGPDHRAAGSCGP